MFLFLVILGLVAESCVAVSVKFVTVTAEPGIDVDIPEDANYCPSFCDEDGDWHRPYYCVFPPHCCKTGDLLTCCFNASLSIDDSIKDDNNCDPTAAVKWLDEYWKVLIGIGVTVAVISLVGSLSLFSYQMYIDRRNRRRRIEEDRYRTDSSVSTVSQTSSTMNTSFTEGCVNPGVGAILDDVEPIKPPPYTNDKPPPYMP